MSDKVEQITGVIGDPKSWTVVEETGDELVTVLIPGGRGGGMKMRKGEAIRRGLWLEPDTDAGRKAQSAKPNKQRRPSANKGA